MTIDSIEAVSAAKREAEDAIANCISDRLDKFQRETGMLPQDVRIELGRHYNKIGSADGLDMLYVLRVELELEWPR